MFERFTGKWKAIYLNEISTLKPFEKNQTGCIWFSCKLLPGHIFISCSVSEIHQDIETPKELVTKARKICSRSRQLHKMWNFKSSFWCCKWCKNFMKKEKKIKTHFRTHVMMTLGHLAWILTLLFIWILKGLFTFEQTCRFLSPTWSVLLA